MVGHALGGFLVEDKLFKGSVMLSMTDEARLKMDQFAKEVFVNSKGKISQKLGRVGYWACEGKSSLEIANLLKLSDFTSRDYLKHLKKTVNQNRMGGCCATLIKIRYGIEKID